MRPTTWCESVSANQFTQAGHVSLNVRRAQEVFCSLPLRLFTTSKPRQPKNRRCPQCGSTARTPALVLAHTHTHTHLLFPSLLPLVLRVLQHLLPPQVEEVGWVGVELQALLPVIPAEGQKNHIQLMSWWVYTTFYYGAKLKKNIMVSATHTFV